MYSSKRQLGNIGEDIAIRFLEEGSFKIKERNFLRKVGEIDIVAEKDGAPHFIEVKSAKFSVSHETDNVLPTDFSIYSNPKNPVFDRYFLEENVHSKKRIKFAKTINWYIREKHISKDKDFFIDIIAVLIDIELRKALIRMTEHVSLLG